MTIPTKTFGLSTPRELHEKLEHDIQRLRDAKFSPDVKYAAFDCAVTAWHIVDWVIHALTDRQHLRLCGCPKGDPAAHSNFIRQNGHRLPALEWCRQIANSVKHVAMSGCAAKFEKKNVATYASVVFEPPFDTISPHTWSGEIRAFAGINVSGNRYPVIVLFEAMANQWSDFLAAEGL